MHKGPLLWILFSLNSFKPRCLGLNFHWRVAACLGQLAVYLGMDGRSSWDAQLFTFTARGKSWARQRSLDLHIKPLTAASLGVEKNSYVYPELSSRVKASRARVLLAFVANAAVEFESMLPHDADAAKVHDARLRASMLWTLDAALSIWGSGSRPFLDEREVAQSCRYLAAHLSCYQSLAHAFLMAGQCLYKLRPKHHYLCHLHAATLSTWLNPMHMGCFMDEDMMKQMRSCAHACHADTMLRAWARRYILKRTLLWSQL